MDISQNKKKKRILRRILIGIAILLVLVVLLYILLKPIYVKAELAKENFLKSIDYANNGDYMEARSYAELSEENFSDLKDSLQNFKAANFLLGKHIDTGMYYLETGEVVSQLIISVSDLAYKIDELWLKDKKKFSDLGNNEKTTLIKYIDSALPEFKRLKQELDILLSDYENHKITFMSKESNKEIEGKLMDLNTVLDKGIFVGELFSIFLGYPEESTYLLVFQNNHEIRPTGGFIGSYGVLSIKEGKISRMLTDDIYHLDFQAVENMKLDPPEPIRKYLEVDKWYMRDGNWSPDWPTSAIALQSFFNLESPEKFNFKGVVGITPKVISDILGILGPINVDGEEFNKDNFHYLLQYKTGREYWENDIAFWDRKNIIGGITDSIKDKFINLPREQWLDIVKSFDNNVRDRDILIYLNDNDDQDIVERIEADGSLKNVESNYLMVVDSNMNAFKTDAVMDKNISLIEKEKDGKKVVELNIRYKHNGSFDWRTTRYRTFTRIYVPLGSKLISVEGDSDDFITNEVELEKNVFGAFLSIEPGEEGFLRFKYELPDDLEEGLYIQKQPGSVIQELDIKGINHSYKGPFIEDIILK